MVSVKYKNKYNDLSNKNFYEVIKMIVINFQFTQSSEDNNAVLLENILIGIRETWPQITSTSSITVDIDKETYNPIINLNEQLIAEMEYFYPEAMI